MSLLFFPVTIASSAGCQRIMLLCVTNGIQPVLSNYIIHLFINAQSKNRLALTFQTWLQQRLSCLSNQWAEGGKRILGGRGLIRNQSKHPREQHVNLLGYRYCYLSGKAWQLGWCHPFLYSSCFLTQVEAQHELSRTCWGAYFCTDPRLKALLRSRTEEWWQTWGFSPAGVEVALSCPARLRHCQSFLPWASSHTAVGDYWLQQ